MQRYLLLTALVASFVGSSDAVSCFTVGEHLVGGRCYRLVDQKLSFEDARSWCHYQNPSTYSYLATVPDQNTANFLASFALTSFGNDNNFWIGLSKSNNKYQWDSGYPLGWTNFLVQNSGIYVAESAKNAKWSTFGPDAKFNFVCSYDPTESVGTSLPPWTTTATETPNPSTTSACLPSDPTTFLFAYSNDLAPNAIATVAQSAINNLFLGGVRNFTHFANIRFDVQVPEEVKVHENTTMFIDSVNANLPDPTLSFLNQSAGTDAIETVMRLMRSHPVCGAVIVMLVARKADEQDISEVVEVLQSNFVSVYITAPYEMIGGSTTVPLYDLSSRTNGVCSFDNNPFFLVALYTYQAINWNPVFAANVEINGQGNKTLGDSSLPFRNLTLGILQSVRAKPLPGADFIDWTHASSYAFFANRTSVVGTLAWFTATFAAEMPDRSDVSLNYDYTNNETLQIRFYSSSPVTGWPAYDNNF